MAEYMDIKEIAKQIRTDLKNLKGYKFSVTIERFSGGSSISVAMLTSPIQIKRNVEDIPNDPNIIGFNDNADLKGIQNYTYHQLNEYQLKDDYDVNMWCNSVFLTKAGHDILKNVVDISKKHHYDNSDPMSDYFDTNFYLHVSLGKWDKDFIDGN